MPHHTPRLPSSLARWAAIALAASLAAGCSVLQEDKIDYKSAQKGSTLDVPPDLTQLNRDVRYQVPGSVVTASGYQTGQPAAASGPSTATNAVGDVRKAMDIQLRLLPVHKNLFVEANPIPVKWAMARLGLCGETMRLPLTPMTRSLEPLVEGALQSSGLLA